MTSARLFHIALFLFSFLGLSRTSHSQPTEPPAPLLPSYLSLTQNINDFTSFSDSGWDGNWYIGYDSCWIVRLGSAPSGNFSKAFIGAKIGRAKTRRKRRAKGFQKKVIPGKIYMAIASTPAFPAERSFFLTETKDVPIESDPKLASDSLLQPGWFWAEIPLGLVNAKGPNFLAIWSPTPDFTSRSNAPILGASMSNNPVPNTWLNRSIKGVPPRDASASLETPVSRLLPAMAIKLVPENEFEVSIHSLVIEPAEDELRVKFSVGGENIDRGWVEVSLDRLEWKRVGTFLRQPPYFFILPADSLPQRDFFLRAAANDSFGNTGTTPYRNIGLEE